MKEFRFIHIISTIFSILALSLPALSEENASPGEDGKVEGKVYESGTSQPVMFANVVIFNPSDSSMVTGGLTNEEGIFKLDDVPYGNYYMTIDFIGYQKRVIPEIKLNRENKILDVGDIELAMTAIELSAAQVTAEKMAVEYRVDRKVINVDQDLDGAGNSAVQILEKAPSIRVDINGDVYLRGSSNFTVLIDGKPTVLTGSEALQQIPANTIENIEIITNPSVRYDPDGSAGIINIVMKKNRLEGLGGVVNATVGTNDKYATDLFLNYKTGKFNIFGGAEWNDRRWPWENTSNRETYATDTTFYKDLTGTGGWLRDGFKFRGGVDYSPSDDLTYSLGGEYGNFGFGMDNYQYIHEYSLPANNVRRFINDDSRRWEREYFSLNGSIKKDFDKETGHSLSVYSFYSNRDGSEIQDKTEINTDENWNPIDPFPLQLRSSEAGPSQRFRFESDYVRPVGETGKVEMGYHYRYYFSNEATLLETWDYDRSEWIEDERYTKFTDFTRHIHAIYGIYNNKFKSLEYQLGLRGEYTYRDITVTNTGEGSLVDRFDFFPSVHLANRFNDKNQVMASYSKRIDRPRGWYLEPYETFIDENTRRLGNPALLPEYTNSFEFGYLRTLGAGNVSLDVYYKHTNNKITSYNFVDPETGILYIQNRNLNNDQATGIESSFIYDITKWFNVNLSGTFYNYRLDDRTEESGSIRTSNNWDIRTVAGFKLPTNTRIQVNFSYESPTVAAQGKREENYFTDITLRQDLLEKKLSLTFRVSDVFGTRKEITTTTGENFYLYEYQQREVRMMMLTVSYKLNNFRPNQRARNEMGGDM